jgi:hypothetical protein
VNSRTAAPRRSFPPPTPLSEFEYSAGSRQPMVRVIHRSRTGIELSGRAWVRAAMFSQGVTLREAARLQGGDLLPRLHGSGGAADHAGSRETLASLAHGGPLGRVPLIWAWPNLRVVRGDGGEGTTRSPPSVCGRCGRRGRKGVVQVSKMAVAERVGRHPRRGWWVSSELRRVRRTRLKDGGAGFRAHQFPQGPVELTGETSDRHARAGGPPTASFYSVRTPS